MEVEMDVSGVHHHHHHQEMMSSQTLESMLVCNKAQEDQKKPRPPEEALKCPRCDSSNTKFCYYNNYSLTQPRYFCKSCRRYWTKGGTLRNVPVGGGCRKNKRSSSSSSATSSNSSSSSALSKMRPPQDHHLIPQHPLNIITSNSNNHLLSALPHLPYNDSTCTDLSLAFARLQSQANGQLGYDHFDHNEHHLGSNDHLGFLDAIRGGFLENTSPTPSPNGFIQNMVYNGGNGDMGNLMSSGNHDGNQEMMFHLMNNSSSSCGATTAAVTMTTVKQEACNMMRPSQELLGENSKGVLWGFPWQMGAGGGGDQGNMIHEVESAGGRSQIAGWNSTAWHGLINSPLM